MQRVAELTTGKFERLAEYFGEMTVGDLTSLTEDDLLESVTAKDKLVMRVLLSEKLRPYLDKPDPFSLPGNKPVLRISAAPSELRVVTGYLDLEQQLMSSRFEHVPSNLISVRDLLSRIKDTINNL